MWYQERMEEPCLITIFNLGIKSGLASGRDELRLRHFQIAGTSLGIQFLTIFGVGQFAAKSRFAANHENRKHTWKILVLVAKRERFRD